MITYEVPDEYLTRIIVQEDGCWIWKGTMRSGGYGRVSPGGRHTLAHRAVYETLVGLIPEGLVIDHLCRVRSCVNPQHLEPVTQRENLLRGESYYAVNARKTSCKYGHEFTEENIVSRADYVGARRCRECERLRSIRRYREKVGSK